MARQFAIAGLADASHYTNIVVCVHTTDSSASVLPGTPNEIAGISIPPVFTKDWCATQGLSTTPGSLVALRSVSGPNLIVVMTAGAASTPEQWRRVGASIARLSPKVATLAVVPLAFASAETTQALAEGAGLASYDYKNPESAASLGVAFVGEGRPDQRESANAGIATGNAIAELAGWARRLGDTPAMELSPKDFAAAAKERLSGVPGVDVEIWKESKIHEERLGGLIGVSLGSDQPARLVHARYSPVNATDATPHYIIVGKGVTFDSGGLNIKSFEGMMTMKTDMSGAAIAVAVVAAAAHLELPIRVSAITPLTENMTGPKAMRPGDVLTIRDGQTVEVLNTDAEGRLILSDALCLAAEEKPTAIIDIATLTGAQVVALGDEMGALYASDDDLAAGLSAASEQAGEPFWRMPLPDFYETHLDSDMADMRNIGKAGKAGSVSAALFLRRFVGANKWAHFDIAGPSRSDNTRTYYNRGATAFGMRTILTFLRDASK